MFSLFPHVSYSKGANVKHPISVKVLTDSYYQKYVKATHAKGNYPASLALFTLQHPGATHGVFDADDRLVYIGKAADLRAAHKLR